MPSYLDVPVLVNWHLSSEALGRVRRAINEAAGYQDGLPPTGSTDEDHYALMDAHYAIHRGQTQEAIATINLQTGEMVLKLGKEMEGATKEGL